MSRLLKLVKLWIEEELVIWYHFSLLSLEKVPPLLFVGTPLLLRSYKVTSICFTTVSLLMFLIPVLHVLNSKISINLNKSYLSLDKEEFLRWILCHSCSLLWELYFCLGYIFSYTKFLDDLFKLTSEILCFFFSENYWKSSSPKKHKWTKVILVLTLLLFEMKFFLPILFVLLVLLFCFIPLSLSGLTTISVSRVGPVSKF